MAPQQAPAAAAAATAAGDEGDRTQRTVSIHILSPSLSGSDRFTLHGVPLRITVGELRGLIAQSFPGHPGPSTQRLIHRGRPLVVDGHRLFRVLSPVEDNEFAVHMVLPLESAANDNSFTSGTGTRVGVSSQFQAPIADARIVQQNGGDSLRFRGVPPPANTHEQNGQQHIWNAMDNGTPQGTGPPPPYSVGIPSPADVTYFEDLYRQVESAELSLDHGFVPQHELMYQLRVRTEILLHQQAQYQGHPLYASAHALMQRVMALYRRIDQLPATRDDSPGPSSPFQSIPQVFLATGPDGRQSLIMPAANAAIFPLAVPMPQAGNIPTAHTGDNHVHHGAPAGQHPGVGQDIVRQAVINQQRRREVENVPVGQYLRRIWLFIRLYFCIYMISSSGTWARVFLVAGAVLIALLSDTEIPRRFQEILITPIQRHLEGLAHLGGPADQATQGAGGQNAATAQAGGNAPDTIQGELWSSIRRMERAIVLLLASLIPGIGERQVEARNAAEAEAERLRQEEQQRLQDQQQQQEEAQAHPQPDVAGDHTGVNGTTVNGEATGQPHPEPQPQPAVPA
ncbi:uncharacterized protein N7473_010250 [Penicillium subrubescens]|uniref:Ubiquitin-like domain-containing protein n=1 Tax=Penicillium subrubescens TaxID=1316194 RepID=A0A1Q5UD86_9EURO|nr:uncharacterized protein N7473_010250 [Penicillium subrubescens]KAJ5883364.1 hypothetical protein N7473_010250 [Penicillium subrubescens]OKP10424.1 hypothetical protein PENSUB_4148 [Penicillium subrubescens]